MWYTLLCVSFYNIRILCLSNVPKVLSLRPSVCSLHLHVLTGDIYCLYDSLYIVAVWHFHCSCMKIFCDADEDVQKENSLSLQMMTLPPLNVSHRLKASKPDKSPDDNNENPSYKMRTYSEQ